MSAGNQTVLRGRPSSRTVALVAAVALVIAALATADKFLENLEQAELQSQAQRAYASGSRLLGEGKVAQALDALRKAHALERENVGYELELIETLMAVGKTEEAEGLVNEVLQREPNDGSVNLAAARVMAKKGKIVEAESYYHRAIYGEWPDKAAAHRISARMELVGFLVSNGKKEELLAELLPLEEEAGKNAAIEKRLAQLFLTAGSPSRAADVYHRLIRRNAKDATSYAGLGEAELERGDYHAAHTAFSQASGLSPNDASIREQLELSSTLALIDPTPRWLASMEKYHRSLRVLELAYADLQECIVNHPSVGTDETGQLLNGAEDAVSGEVPAHVTNEISEGILSLAEKIWQARIKSCGTGTAPDEEATRLIMEKLTQ